MRHTISAHAGLPREESYSPLSEVLLSQNKLFAQCPRSRRAHRPHQSGFSQCQGHCAGSAGVRKTPPPFLPFQIRHGAQAWAALTPCQCYTPPTPVHALVISAKRTHSTRNSSPGETTAVSGYSPFLHTGLGASVWRPSHPGAPNTEGTLVRPWVEMIWKNKLSCDILVLTKALAEHRRGRDWLKKLWQLGRLLWMRWTPPLSYVYKATCCTALFIAQTAQQKTVSIFPMGEAASGYFTARKSHRSFFFPSRCLRLYTWPSSPFAWAVLQRWWFATFPGPKMYSGAALV